MSRQSVARAHQKIQELAWEPKYHEPVSQYGTDYTFRKAAKKDPLKQVLRSYFPMQEEKDHRVYGASDGAIRGHGPSSNALRAASTARFTSSTSASGTCVSTSPVAGLYTGNVLPEAAATKRPSISMR